jgi:hypothetical protein
MTENPSVINLQTRKAFEQDVPKAVIDEASLGLALDILERVKSGRLTHLGMIGVYDDRGISAMIKRDSSTIIPLAMLRISVDALKDQVRGAIREYTFRPEDDPK